MRYHILKGPLDCYYAPDVDGQPVAVITSRNNNFSAEQMAFYLMQAAGWFQQVAKGKVQPNPKGVF